MIVYYVINKVGTLDYYHHGDGRTWGDIGDARRFDKEEFAFGVMKQYVQHFRFPCKIEKIYHLR